MSEPALELDLVGLAAARLRERIDEDDLPVVEQAFRIGDSTPSKIPAVVVYLLSDELSESTAPQAGAIQRVNATLAVVHVIAARNTPRDAGGPAVDPMAKLTGCTRSVLNGWKPREGSRRDPLTLRRGRLVDVADGRAVWQDEYTVSWRARGVQDQQGG